MYLVEKREQSIHVHISEKEKNGVKGEEEKGEEEGEEEDSKLEKVLNHDDVITECKYMNEVLVE